MRGILAGLGGLIMLAAIVAGYMMWGSDDERYHTSDVELTCRPRQASPTDDVSKCSGQTTADGMDYVVIAAVTGLGFLMLANLVKPSQRTGPPGHPGPYPGMTGPPAPGPQPGFQPPRPGPATSPPGPGPGAGPAHHPPPMGPR